MPITERATTRLSDSTVALNHPHSGVSRAHSSMFKRPLSWCPEVGRPRLRLPLQGGLQSLQHIRRRLHVATREMRFGDSDSCV